MPPRTATGVAAALSRGDRRQDLIDASALAATSESPIHAAALIAAFVFKADHHESSDRTTCRRPRHPNAQTDGFNPQA